MKISGIGDLSAIHIVCDRGSNFLKAFQHLNPFTCYGHRLNNVLKRSFFPHQKQSTIAQGVGIEKISSSDDDDSFYIPSKPIKKKDVNVGEKNAMTTKLIDASPAAQQLIKTIVVCKLLAKYIKEVSTLTVSLVEWC